MQRLIRSGKAASSLGLINRTPALSPPGYQQRAMATTTATSSRVHVGPDQTGLLGYKQTDDGAAKVSELLQSDLDHHHVFFNTAGYHNHIVHHLLSAFGTGASPSALQKAYADNDPYQRPPVPYHEDVSASLEDPSSWPAHLGNEKYYPDFFAFFRREIDRDGWQAVVRRYICAPRDDDPTNMLGRMFAGFLHPLIQLMFGVEWEQPAIVAAALAQAAVHKDNVRDFLLEAEDAAAARRREGGDVAPMPPIMDIITAIRKDPELSVGAQMKDANKVYDGIFKRARDSALRLAAGVHVEQAELDEKTAEMFHATILTAALAAFRKGKTPKFDFFLM